MRRAAELRRNPTEAEAKLWARLRAHRLNGLGFRRQRAIGPYIVDFCHHERRSSSNWMAANTSTNKNMIQSARPFLKPKDIRCCVFGTTW
jgi:hypothetical protein